MYHSDNKLLWFYLICKAFCTFIYDTWSFQFRKQAFSVAGLCWRCRLRERKRVYSDASPVPWSALKPSVSRSLSILGPTSGWPKTMQNWNLAQWHPKAVAMGPGAPLGRPLAATCLKRYRFWDHFGSPLAPLGRRWFRPFIKGRETRFYWKNQ